jgi:ADP-dependent NAD(P)H-hydrate dehydratase / NAD(P)H-hydrate epimerase
MQKVRFEIKRRRPDAHKGDFGHVLVVAGSSRMTGAAYLCCEAAMLSGAGLVTLAIPKSLNIIMQRKLTEVMTLPLPETRDNSLSIEARNKILLFSKRADCLLLGPGLSRNAQTQNLVRSLIRDTSLPMVIDADALNALSGHLSVLEKKMTLRQKDSEKTGNIILTPHAGEMARITGLGISFINNNKKGVAKKFSREYNVTTVLKGCKTVVSSPRGKPYVNDTGNPGMASAGCGDVLAGIISALLASGMDTFKAARLGVYVHGLAGDIAAKETGEISLRARDLLKFLPKAFKKVYS